jgi:hypothetical protein
MVDEKRTGLGDVLSQSPSDPSRDEHDQNPGREPERHAWSAHPYANPLAAANPAPIPARRSSARSPSSPASPSGINVWGGDDDGDNDSDNDNRGRGGDGDGDHDGDQAVNEEYAFGSRRGLSIRARMDGAGTVYGSRGNRSRQQNEIGTEYVRHTDAGVVRVVELPPLYNDLRR